MFVSDYFLLIGAGFFVGILAGFIGIGGNVVLIPIALELFRARGIPDEVRTHLTYGTMLTVTVITAISSTIRQHFQKAVLWRLTPWIILGSIIATQTMGSQLRAISGSTLQFFFAVMILTLGVRWLVTRNHPDAPEMKNLKWHYMLGSGFLIGIISVLTGLGGGGLF